MGNIRVGDQFIVKVKRVCPQTGCVELDTGRYTEIIGPYAAAMLERYDPDAYSKGYNQGSKDAWEAARALYTDYSKAELLKMLFGSRGEKRPFRKILTEFTAGEAIRAIREYEATKIRVGDVCVYKSNPDIPFVITRIYYEGDTGFFYGLYMDGSVVDDGSLELIEKTGNAYPQLAEILGQMAEKKEE